MKFIRNIIATITAIATIAMSETPVAGFTVTKTNNTSDLLNTLLGDTTGLSNFAIETTGHGDAFGWFTNDPFGLESGIVLSTGNVVNLPGVNQSSLYNPDLNTDFGLPGDVADSYDLAQIQITFDADRTVEKLYFQYVFGSEEFVEYGGTEFNDSFELLLNGVNLAKLSDDQTVAINHLVPDPDGRFHPDYINNPAGLDTLTKLDGYTTSLIFEALINQKAQNTLTIKIKDTADSFYDSAVFLKGGTLGTVNPTKVPEPGSIAGLLLMSIGISSAALYRAKKM